MSKTCNDKMSSGIMVPLPSIRPWHPSPKTSNNVMWHQIFYSHCEQSNFSWAHPTYWNGLRVVCDRIQAKLIHFMSIHLTNQVRDVFTKTLHHKPFNDISHKFCRHNVHSKLKGVTPHWMSFTLLIVIVITIF